jgi:hypothetical protein
LAGDHLFDSRLRLVQQLLAAVGHVSQRRHKIPGLQSHVKLEMSNIFTEIFSRRSFYWSVHRSHQSVLSLDDNQLNSDVKLTLRQFEPQNP